MFIYIDESGEMGHDLVKEGTSRYFVVAALVVYDQQTRRKLEAAVKRTLKNKVLAGKKKADKVAAHTEIKGASTSFEVKRYFWRLVEDLHFDIHAVVMEKDDKYPKMTGAKKDDLYRVLVGLLYDRIHMNGDNGKLDHVEIYIDEGRKHRGEFDRTLRARIAQLTSNTSHVPIHHVHSHESKPIQAIDLFAWGIARKYERRERTWYDLYQGKIKDEATIKIRP